MAPERRNQVLLAAVTVVLLIVVYRAWAPTSGTPSPSSNQNVTALRTARATPPQVAAPEVHLDSLNAERPKPTRSERNLFRFKQKAPPPAPPQVTKPVELAPPAPTGPPPPPPLPPITLKFIGTFVRNGQRMAVLSDAAGHVEQGVEGEIIGGRFRVLKIGEQSIEMAYLDGRGRQTIRLTGS
jgi:hypothetical protein